MNKPKGLRRQVKDGEVSVEAALLSLVWAKAHGEWIRPSIVRWLRRKAQA